MSGRHTSDHGPCAGFPSQGLLGFSLLPKNPVRRVQHLLAKCFTVWCERESGGGPQYEKRRSQKPSTVHRAKFTSGAGTRRLERQTASEPLSMRKTTTMTRLSRVLVQVVYPCHKHRIHGCCLEEGMKSLSSHLAESRTGLSNQA